MRSNYYGEANFGNNNNNEKGRSSSGSSSSSSSSSSSRKNKNKSSSNNSDKPKQPQRGLGVAQLEKMRLHGLSTSSTTFTPYHPQFPNYPSTNFNIHEHQMRVVHNSYSSIPSSSFCNYSSSSSSSYSPSYGFNTNIMMGLCEYERRNIRYDDSQPSTTTGTGPRWDSSISILDNQQFVQPNCNIISSNAHLLNQQDYNHEQMRGKKHISRSLGSSSPNSESRDDQQLDLELRLSL